MHRWRAARCPARPAPLLSILTRSPHPTPLVFTRGGGCRRSAHPTTRSSSSAASSGWSPSTGATRTCACARSSSFPSTRTLRSSWSSSGSAFTGRATALLRAHESVAHNARCGGLGLAHIVRSSSSAWSGQSIYNDSLLAMFNVIYSSLPPLAQGIFEKDISEHAIYKEPRVWVHRCKKNPARERARPLTPAQAVLVRPF